MASSIDRATAQLRWPGYEVSGAGRIAVVCQCNPEGRPGHVAAGSRSDSQQERCGQHCSHMIAPEGRWHLLRKLDEPTRNRNNETFGNIAALMERE